MPRRPTRVLLQNAVDTSAPTIPRLADGDRVWVTTRWAYPDGVRTEQIPARAFWWSEEDLVYCRWFEPRRDEDGAWLSAGDVAPRPVIERAALEEE